MTRTPRRSSTKARYTVSPEERAERLAAAREQLLEGVDKLMTADGWQQLITSRAWLRRYSLNNLIMILQQCPEATDVRPLSEWKREGYGLMRKGTHKIKIWKPCFRKADGDENTDRSAEKDTDEITKLSGFMLVPVVDVSQLQGDPRAAQPPLPEPIALSGDAPRGLWDGVAAQITGRGYAVERGDCGGAFGRTVFAERRVIVRAGVEPAQTAKTLTHELAHILCDHETRFSATPRAVLEVETESVACVVASVCGLDTLSYSVPYVAGWATDRDTARTSAERVLRVADRILDGLDRTAAEPLTAQDHPVVTYDVPAVA